MRFIAFSILLTSAAAFMPLAVPRSRSTRMMAEVPSAEDIAKKLGSPKGSQVEAEVLDNNVVRVFRTAFEYQRAEKDEEGNDEIVPPFQDLFILLGYAGLLDTLQLEEGPFTVFAPTDDAFHKFLWGDEAGKVFPAGADKAAIKEKVKQLLLYHVVSGKVTAADVAGLSSAKSLQGGDIAIAVDGGAVKLNGNVNVIKADLDAANGVVHVVDGVLVPK